MKGPGASSMGPFFCASLRGHHALDPDRGLCHHRLCMWLESLIEQALTAALSEQMEARGEALFAALKGSGRVPEAEWRPVEEAWRTMIAQRRAESEGAREALASFVEALRATGKLGEGSP